MKTLIYLLFVIPFLTSITFIEEEDNNLYYADMQEVVVTHDILEGYIPKRCKTKEEFMHYNKPLIQFVAKYSWLTEGQVYGKLRQEQGLGSQLMYIHNNPFNIKGNRSSGTVVYKTKEFDKNGNVYYTHSHFARYDNIKDSLLDFIDFIQNERYNHEPCDNRTAFKHFYVQGYHTDPRWYIRAKYADEYEKTINEEKTMVLRLRSV